MNRIVIIGGGFSGTLTAINLARLAQAPLHITIVNSGYPACRGIAYSTRRPEHLLNVAARNMSALPDHPHHFLDWLRTRSEFADTPEPELRETFIPRQLYGDYLRGLALHYTQPVDRRAQAHIEMIEGEAVDIHPCGNHVTVHLAGGRHLPADKVVLASGNEPPADLPGAGQLTTHRAWCGNPWGDWHTRLPPDGGSIVLLGTGLTTVDAVLTLLRLNWRGPIHAVSRNGLLPQSHFKGIEYDDFPPKEIDLTTLGLQPLITLLEAHCARLIRLGANPGIIVDKMRPHTQRVWQAFTLEDKRAFATGHASRWNVIRHRIAPSIHQQITTALITGALQIHRATVTGLEANGADQVRVLLRGEGAASTHLDGALVINATGPHTRFSKTRSPLMQNLLAAGLIQPDEMDMGIRVLPDHAVVSRTGAGSKSVYAIGPLLRGTLWESIAVPELRGQAMNIAQTLLGDELPAGATRRWTPESDTLAMEYHI
ncbi:MAG TPA: FAD/NAD(P)-binding protein [Prosthecobacter sp.]|nr:FAD/NAD(P)-binding protein [Prosthecobacter sp.]